MNEHSDKIDIVTDVELENVSGGTQEDYFTYQRQDRALTYQRTASADGSVAAHDAQKSIF